jgi:uncharacterized membrane protein
MTEHSVEYGPKATRQIRVKRTVLIPWWVGALVIAGALLTAMGAVIALVRPSMLVSPTDEINGAVHIYAGYLVARNLALALMLLGLLALRARRALGNVMALVALVQMLDVCMDCAEGRWSIVPVALVFGVLYAIGAARLSGGPFWRREAWIGE